MLSNWPNEHLVYMAVGSLDSLAPGSSDIFIIMGTMLHCYRVIQEDCQLGIVCHLSWRYDYIPKTAYTPPHTLSFIMPSFICRHIFLENMIECEEKIIVNYSHKVIFHFCLQWPLQGRYPFSPTSKDSLSWPKS